MLTLLRCCPFLTYSPPLYTKTRETRSLTHPDNESQQRVNDFWSCILGNLSGDWVKTFIYAVKAAFKPKRESDTLPAAFWKWASTERQQCLALHKCKSAWRLVTDIHKWQIGCLHKQNRKQHTPCLILKMSVNRASTIDVHVSEVIDQRLCRCNPYWNYWLSWRSKPPCTTSLLSPKNECQRSINDIGSCNSGNWRVAWSFLYISTVLAAFIDQLQSDTLPAWSWKWASIECQQLFVM